MKILVVSNYYPPYYIGGYELGCYDVVKALITRGHEVVVLTSTYGLDKPIMSEGTYRCLRGQFAADQILNKAKLFLKVFKDECYNQEVFKRICAHFQPDIVYMWNMDGISISLVFVAQRLGVPVSFFVSDQWLSYWERDKWYSLLHREPKTLLKKIVKSIFIYWVRSLNVSAGDGPLDLSHVQFCSQFLKDKAIEDGKFVSNSQIIHWGVDTDQYTYCSKSGSPIRLLYVGRVTPEKGVHTAVQALKIIAQESQYNSVTLTIAGECKDIRYKVKLQEQISSHGLDAQVQFIGPQTRKEILDLYRKHDILIFPSVWDEPFGITPLEAMASGIAVVGTATGGSAEIFQNGYNSLVFSKEDALGCAKQVLCLLQNSDLYHDIRYNGRQCVVEHYKFEDMANKITHSLCALMTP